MSYRAEPRSGSLSVITTPHTFAATREAITHAGRTIRFVDVDRLTGSIDPGKLDAAITSKTKALLPIHPHGQPADMDAPAKNLGAYGDGGMVVTSRIPRVPPLARGLSLPMHPELSAYQRPCIKLPDEYTRRATFLPRGRKPPIGYESLVR